MATDYAATYTLLSCLFLSVVCYLYTKPSKLPPGPVGLPIVGNMHRIPTSYPWKQFQEWHKVYGPIVHVRLGKVTAIFLGNHQVAKDILSKRSTLYNSRPEFVLAAAYGNRHLESLILPHGPQWKQLHAIQMSLLNSRKCRLYHPLHDLESRHLLFNLSSTNDFDAEFHRYSASLIFALLYGRRLEKGDDPQLKEIGQLLISIKQALLPGNWLDSFLPMLNLLLRPLAKRTESGDGFSSRKAHCFDKNFAHALRRSSWSWSKQIVSEIGPCVSREELTFVLGEIFEAATATTSGVLAVAILACVSCPGAVRQAQEELDKSVGNGRLPTLGDVGQLPYTRSFVEEVLRWRPLVPTGAPHSPTRDDDYCGFLIPKGAAVFPNHWSLDTDGQVFSCPEDFNPRRWMDKADLPLAAFGFGRRACPGQHLARNSLLLALSRLLWAFDIEWKEDQDTQPDSLPMTQDGVFSRPCPFEATFTVRSSLHREVVESEWAKANKNAADVLDSIGQKFAKD